MKKTINKIIFIFALVILVNIIPTEAKAGTYGITLGSSTVYITMTMGVHYGTSGYTTASTIAYKNDRILINASGTHPEWPVGVGITTPQISTNTYLLSIPSDPYVSSFNYDQILGDLSGGSSGASNLRLTTPSNNGNFNIRLIASDTQSNSNYVDVPFTVDSTPAVATTVSWCNNSEGIEDGLTKHCTEIPQDGSKVTTSAITPGTPLKFTYRPTGLNQGSTCTITKPDATTTTTTPTLNAYNNYPISGTVVAGASNGVYSFRCNNPKVVAVNTQGISQIIGSKAEVKTFSMPSDWSTPYIPTEIGLKYGNYSSQFVPNWDHSGTFTQVVCSGNCQNGPSYMTNLTGLNSSSSYYVQSYSTNSLGTTWGNARQFTTRGSDCQGLDPYGKCISCVGKVYTNGDNHCF